MSATIPPATTGVVLAGGEGSRIGGSKHLVELDGRTLVSRAVAVVAAAGLEPVVAAKATFDTAAAGIDGPVRVLVEPARPVHPLMGVAHALTVLGRPVVTLPCDMPLLGPAVLRLLADHPARVVVAAVDGRVHPLVGRFPPDVAAALHDAARAGDPARSVTGLPGAEVVELTDVDPGWAAGFVNINTRGDLAAARLP